MRTIFFALLILIVTGGIFFSAPASFSTPPRDTESLGLAKNQILHVPKADRILQFEASGHVLGFNESGVYVAAANYMLLENFLDARDVAPRSDQTPPTDGQSQVLKRVSYPDLWPGIAITYDNPDDGIMRSTYTIEPGAEPAQIVLGYNVPAHLDQSGNLVFEFETGTMTACAPIAWQEIKGRRMPVDVAFRLDASGSNVSFSLGAYNSDKTLIIDPTLAWNTFMGGGGIITMMLVLALP